MPGTCLSGEPVCSTKSCVPQCPLTRQVGDNSDGDRSRSQSPSKGPERTSTVSTSPKEEENQSSSETIDGEQDAKNQQVNQSTMSEWGCPPPRHEDTSESSNQNCPSGCPAWLTISSQDQMSCEECCGMPIRGDTPIAELAREWIRFRNAEDTGAWAPCPGEGVYPDSPPMVRFVHYMRSQYTGGCGMLGMDICSEMCEGKSNSKNDSGGVCPPTCPVVQAKGQGRNRSPSASTDRRPPRSRSPSGSPPRMGVCHPCDPSSNLGSVREERERIGEIAEGLRRAVQEQSNSSGCPCCPKGASPKPSPKSRSYDHSPGFNPRLCGPSCHFEDDPPSFHEDRCQPRCPGRYWVDDETKSSGPGHPAHSQRPQPAPRLSRNRSTTQCSPCGGTLRPPGTSHASSHGSSPVAVFNFNECAATFQQHLHSQDGEDFPDECPDTCPGH